MKRNLIGQALKKFFEQETKKIKKKNMMKKFKEGIEKKVKQRALEQKVKTLEEEANALVEHTPSSIGLRNRKGLE